MELKECKCCGGKTLEPAMQSYDICPVCGWEDDPVQNSDPFYEGGANHISLFMAQQAFASGESLLPLKAAAVNRYKERIKRARAAAEARGEEFYEGEAYNDIVAAEAIPAAGTETAMTAAFM